MAQRSGEKRKCRPRYDPNVAESAAKRNVECGKAKVKFEATIQEVFELAKRVLLSDEVKDYSAEAIEVILVASLGLKNVMLIHQAMNLVPRNIPER